MFLKTYIYLLCVISFCNFLEYFQARTFWGNSCYLFGFWGDGILSRFGTKVDWRNLSNYCCRSISFFRIESGARSGITFFAECLVLGTIFIQKNQINFLNHVKTVVCIYMCIFSDFGVCMDLSVPSSFCHNGRKWKLVGNQYLKIAL